MPSYIRLIIMKFPIGTIARNNRTNEKYILNYEIEAIQDDNKELIFRIQDSRGIIFLLMIIGNHYD